MDRTLRKRTLALLVATLSLFTWTGDALGLHACPHHSYIAGVHGAAAREHASPADAGDAHHAEAATPAEAEGHGADAAEHPDHSTCTCLGGCPATAGGALPAPREIHLPSVVLSGRPAVVFAVSPLTVRLVPYVLPYGHAPPAAA